LNWFEEFKLLTFCEKRYLSLIISIKNMADLSREFLKLAWKYGMAAWKSKRKAKQQVEELYSLNYPDKESEMRKIRDHKSRIATSIAFLSLAIYAANRGEKSKESPGAICLTAWQINIGKVASIDDDFHDEILVPYLVQQEPWSVDEIYDLIRDYERIYQLASTLKPTYHSKTGELLVPTDLAGASLRVEKAYSQEIQKSSKSAYVTYVNGKEVVQKSEAKNVSIEVALKKDDIEGVLHIIGHGDYLKKLSELQDKTGSIGGEGAVITNQITWTDKPVEVDEVNQALRETFNPLTKLNQAGCDDLKNIVNDMYTKSPNIFILSMLPEYQDITIENLRKFLSEHPETVSEIFTPLIEATSEGLEKLKSLDFAYEDCKLGFDWSMKNIRKYMKYFKQKLRVDVDESWLDKYK
jgi:hypothetical protein